MNRKSSILMPEALITSRKLALIRNSWKYPLFSGTHLRRARIQSLKLYKFLLCSILCSLCFHAVWMCFIGKLYACVHSEKCPFLWIKKKTKKLFLWIFSPFLVVDWEMSFINEAWDEAESIRQFRDKPTEKFDYEKVEFWCSKSIFSTKVWVPKQFSTYLGLK